MPRACCCIAALLLGACASSETVRAALDPRLAACDAELRAFVAVTGLARQATDWQVYKPALEALRDQILDCVDDSYPTPIGI